MQLLKLPDVIRSDVLQHLHPSDLFILALCSKRSSHALKRNLRLPKPEVWVDNVEAINSWLEVSFYLRTGRNYIKIVSLRSMFGCIEGRSRVNIDWFFGRSGSMLDYSRRDNLRILHHFDLQAFIPSFTKTHKFLCEIFKAPSEICFTPNSSEWDFLPKNSVSRCDFTKINVIDTKSMADFWKVDSNQLCIVDGAKNFTILMASSAHFKNVRNVLVRRSEKYATFVLLPFEGEHLVLEDGSVPLVYLKAFLEKWMKKEGGSLKSVIIKLHPTCSIDKTALLEGITTKKCGNRTLYYYKSIIKEYHTFPIGAFACTHEVDIMRNTDGKRATVKVTNGYFMFLVW